ncbi:hypothetical protein [Streptomyces baarnensis]|uniref:hypothetical protein n=1 Tax=Streptomyces baarnensis TaxID=66872 RepID=UPI001F2CDA91
MLLLPEWTDEWDARAHDFVQPDEGAIYERCVRTVLADREMVRLLGKRPGADRPQVRFQLRVPTYRQFAVARCPASQKRVFDKAWEDLAATRDKHETAAAATTWSWWAVSLLLVVGVLATLWTFGFLILVLLWFVTPLALLLLAPRAAPWFRNLRYCLLATGHGLAWVLQRIELGLHAARWGQTLQEEGVRPVVAQLINHMLGDDPDSLFIPDGHDGLRTPRAQYYMVETAAAYQLKRKLTHLRDGTIAVCGPRGAGKTTLLEARVEAADFGLIAQAPATYTPQDFLLMLAVKLCRRYIEDKGYEVPEFTRLSPFRRFTRRTLGRMRRMFRWSTHALPAGCLLVLGFSSSVRSLYGQYATAVVDLGKQWTGHVSDLGLQIWHGQAAAASVLAIVIGVTWWKARAGSWVPLLLGRLWERLSTLLGASLVVMSCSSVLIDMTDTVVHVNRFPFSITFETPNPAPVLHGPPLNTAVNVVVILALWLGCRALSESDAEISFGKWDIDMEKTFAPLATMSGVGLFFYVANAPYTRSLLADEENPLRIAVIMIGLLLVRVGGWTPQPQEPLLVSRCRNYLYQLQTVQSSASGFTTGASQLLSLGSTHSTSVSTIPPNYPELVEVFRGLLTLIAAEKARSNETVVIAIDEVDRLGSDTKALAFLAEIKAILGIPHVHFLISVADDVAAAFVRRGLPHRDVTDSSLDDIVHVQPSTLEESQKVLAKRSSALKAPHAMLAHTLSGGILRDLLRYGLQIKEMQEKANSYELTDISRHLILEELSETLAGFRTLLSKSQWTQETSSILNDVRTLGSHLRNPCKCTYNTLRHALEQFAFSTPPAPATPRDPVSELQQPFNDPQPLIDEACAYAYFSLTLLDIFSTEGFDRRTLQAAMEGPYGDPERLAEARQELGISPYSTRALITKIREAWSLPSAPTPLRNFPRPRPGECSLHPAGT